MLAEGLRRLRVWSVQRQEHTEAPGFLGGRLRVSRGYPKDEASSEDAGEGDRPHAGESTRASQSTVTGLISRRRGSTSFEKSRMPFSDSAWVMKPERPTRLRWPKPPTLS